MMDVESIVSSSRFTWCSWTASSDVDAAAWAIIRCWSEGRTARLAGSNPPSAGRGVPRDGSSFPVSQPLLPIDRSMGGQWSAVSEWSEWMG